MPGDHAYLAYADDEELRTVATGFLEECLELGQQVAYCGWGGADALRGYVDVVGRPDGRSRRGAVHVVSLDAYFRRDDVPDPATLVRFWSEATSAALAAGFTALRVVTDTTPWVQGERSRTEFLRTEHRVDRFLLKHDFTQLCAGNAQVLDEPALAEAGCIHPSSSGITLPFHLHASHDADFALEGELDAFTVPLFERIVQSARAGERSGELVIDCTEVSFVDHRSLLVLEHHAEEAGLRQVALRGASHGAASLVELLHLSRVRMEAVR